MIRWYGKEVNIQHIILREEKESEFFFSTWAKTRRTSKDFCTLGMMMVVIIHIAFAFGCNWLHLDAMVNDLVTQSIPAMARRRKRTRVIPPTILFFFSRIWKCHIVSGNLQNLYHSNHPNHHYHNNDDHHINSLRIAHSKALTFWPCIILIVLIIIIIIMMIITIKTIKFWPCIIVPAAINSAPMVNNPIVAGHSVLKKYDD